MPQGSSNFIEIARQVLTELGGGPVASGALVAAARERGLINDKKYTYHNFLRKLRESDEFDTSQRGSVALTQSNTPGAELPAAAPAVETEPVPEVSEENPMEEAIPGATLVSQSEI